MQGSLLGCSLPPQARSLERNKNVPLWRTLVAVQRGNRGQICDIFHCRHNQEAKRHKFWSKREERSFHSEKQYANERHRNKANFRANEPSVMIGRFQPRFHKVKLEWNDREKGKGKRFAQNCAVSSLTETLASEANGFLVCSSFVFQKVEVSLCVFPLALPLSFSSWPSSSLFARALSLAFIRTTNKKHTRKTACYEG